MLTTNTWPVLVPLELGTLRATLGPKAMRSDSMHGVAPGQGTALVAHPATLVEYVTRFVEHTMFVSAGKLVNWQTITFVAGIVFVKQTTKFVAGTKFVKQTVAPATLVMHRTMFVPGNVFVKQKTVCEAGKRFVTQTNLFVATVTFVRQTTTLVAILILFVPQRTTLVKQFCRLELSAVIPVRSIR